MDRIVEGILKFKSEVFPQHQALFDDLSGGQSPEVLMITCADSRIDPGLITQARPGELFICRNAGNIVPPHSTNTGGTTASIEYAVAVLGVSDVVVCGHTDCGAMKGALNPEGLASLPHVSNWLANSRAAVGVVEKKYPGLEGEELLQALTEENVLLQLQHLRTHPVIAAGLAENSLRLHGWVYDIGRGEIRTYQENSDSFEPLREIQAVA